MRIQSLVSSITLLVSSVTSTYTLYEREADLQMRRLSHAHENYDPNYHRGPAFQARDIDELIVRMLRREAINAEFYKKQGIIKDTPQSGEKPKCKTGICTPEEMKGIIAWDKAHMGNECKKLDDCKCPGSNPFGKSCLNGKCLCGQANKKVADVATAFATPVMEGMKKFGEEAQKILGDIEAGLKMAIKLGSWLIPGLGPAVKTAMKGLDAALPPAEIKSGNVKADEVLKIMGKILRR